MERTPRPSLARRLPRALMVAFAVALLGGGAIGFATAAGDDAAFQVPAPLGGDKAVYSVTGPGAPWDDQLARLEVRAPQPLMLPDGSWASSVMMRSGADSSSSTITSGDFEVKLSLVGWHGAFVDAADGQPLASMFAAGSSSQASAPGFVSPLGGEVSQQQTVDLRTEFRAAETPCGLRTPLQQRPLAVGERVRLEGCGEEPFRIIGMRPLQGTQALLIESADTRLWYQADVPYPVRFDLDVGDEDATTWSMTGFTRGTMPLAPGPLPPAVEPAPVTHDAVDRFGPEPAGIAARFPLTEAVQHAIDYDQTVEDFAARHPDWFLRSASYSEDEQDDTVTGRWSFSMRGDDQQIFVSVLEPADEDSPVPGEVNQALGDAMQAAGMPGSNLVSASDRDPFPEPAWPAECRPSQLPGLSGLAARWGQMQQRPASEANAYRFFLYCAVDDVIVPGHELWVGDARIVHPPSQDSDPLGRPAPGNSTQVLHMLGLDSRGDLSVETTEAAMSRSSWGALQPPPTQEDANGIERASATGVWSAPAGPMAASITLVSLLAGALYWLWPAVKAGPLGLFSRLQTPDLLDHPVRKELAQRIEAQPGVHYQDLVRAMGKGKGAIEHHLRKLQEGGLVKSVSAAGYTCFFPATFDRRLTAAAPALKSLGARKVLAAIQANPGASATDVGLATGLSPAAVNHHLQRLGAAGLVDVLRNGRSLSLQPTALASQVAAAGA